MSGVERGERVLVVAPPLDRAGGVQQVARDLLEVLGTLPVGVSTVCYRPGRLGPLAQLTFDLRALVALLRLRPTLLVLLNVRYVPLTIAVCRLLRRRYVVTAHGREVWGPLPVFRRHVLPGAAAVWCVSSYTRDRVAEVHPVDPGRLRLLLLGVDVPAELPQRHESPEPSVLFVGRLERAVRYKGVDTILAAWPQVVSASPRATLLVVGTGDDRAALEVEAQALPGIHFLGRVDDAELARLRASAWVACFPTRVVLGTDPQGEGLGLVALEAMAAGLPLVASAAGGSSDVVDASRTRIVDEHDPSSVAAGLVELLDDADERERLRTRAHAFVRDDRDRTAFSRSVLALLVEQRVVPDSVS